ncbi:MAG: YkvA family protein [Hyphomicrobiaceae bacterium]
MPLEGEVLTPEEIRHRAERVERGFWPKLRKVVRRIPFSEDLIAAYYCAMDAQTPLRVRATLLGALAYFIMPVDGIPDVIAGLGFTDDAAVLAIALKMVASHISPKHREQARSALAEKLPMTGEDAKSV